MNSYVVSNHEEMKRDRKILQNDYSYTLSVDI